MRLLALAAIVLAASAPAQRDSRVTGARISLVKKEQSTLRVTIENRRDSMLVELEVNSGFALVTQRVAVGPGERQAISTPLQNGVEPGASRVIFAAFADGYAEGETPAVRPRLAERQSHIDDLGFWVRAFMNMPRVSSVDVRRFLIDRIGERAVVDRPNVAHVSDRVRDLLRRYPEGPDIWDPLDALRTQVERELTAATTPGDKPPVIVDSVTSAAVVSSERVPSTAYSVAIENVRAIPIEALAYEMVDPAGRRRGGRTMDFCLSDPGDRTSGHGHIQPNEHREEMYGGDDPSVDLRVSFVLFDDLSFEGSPAVRDDILRRREETADEYAFAIDTVKAAAARPVADVEAFLVAAKVERTKQLLAAGRQPRPIGPLDEALRVFRESPSTFAERMSGYRASLEQAVQRLRRHLSAAAAK